MSMRLQGYTYAAIGRELGISPQRVQQITTAPRAVRQAIALAAEYRCQHCGIQLGTSGSVHHKEVTGLEAEPYNDFPNLMYLCISCHGGAHTGLFGISAVEHAERIRRTTENVRRNMNIPRQQRSGRQK